MSYKRGLGIGLIFVGAIIILTSRIITGAVVGTGPENYLGLLGVLMLIAGMVLVLITKSLDTVVDEKDVDTRKDTNERHESRNVVNYERLKAKYRQEENLIPVDVEKDLKKYGPPPEANEKDKWIDLYHAIPLGSRRIRRFGRNGKLIGTKQFRGGGLHMHDDPESVIKEFPSYTRGDLQILKIRISKEVYKDLKMKRRASQLAQKADGEPKQEYVLPNKQIKRANALYQEGYIKLEKLN
jgi:hypothetical protein